MLLLARQDLLALTQLQAVDDTRQTFACAGCECQLRGVARERSRIGGAQLAGQLAAALEVLAGASAACLFEQLCGASLCRRCWDWAVGASV